ncbi:MAG: hypothetical protein JXX29_01555 [Deltaproteobacteria bacterium]|nr:hypothetical protein [Deltaproteobacteria bacterium]
MSYTDFQAELNLPSVIIDVPELEKMVAKKKMIHMAMFAVAGVFFLVLSGLIFLELTSEPTEVVKVEAVEANETDSITLTVKLVPGNIPGAVVQVDGDVISGNPPYAYLTPSEDYHSIRVTAPGYEGISKDVQLSTSEVMTFAMTPTATAVQMADNDGQLGMEDDLDTDSFGTNSDDLIEELDDSQVVAEAPAVDVTEESARDTGGSARRAGGRGKQVSLKTPARTTANPATSVAAAAPVAKVSQPSTAAHSAAVAKADGANSSSQYGLGPAPSTAAASGPAKASLIINAPLGMTSRVAVSVDGQMRGYLPVLLKIDPGLHELTFVYEGHRTFQMVKLSSGQIARIVPNL